VYTGSIYIVCIFFQETAIDVVLWPCYFVVAFDFVINYVNTLLTYLLHIHVFREESKKSSALTRFLRVFSRTTHSFSVPNRVMSTLQT
jgi:hypothetical protein